jgi:uncharacterized protein (DUF2384 family)
METRRLLLRMLRETFATPTDARHWWRSPHPVLGGAAPSAAARTASGAERVREVLVALRYGGVV